MTDLSMLKMVRELVSAIKTRVCGEKAPLWQDDYHTTFSRGVIADQCDYAIAAVAPIIARMEQNGSASAIDGEKREHISAPIAGANPATPATTKDDGLLPDDEWSGLIRNPHLGIPPLPNDVLIDWHDFKKLRKAAEQPAAPQVAGIIADMERTITVTLPLTARDVLAYLLDDLRKQMGFNARGEKK